MESLSGMCFVAIILSISQAKTEQISDSKVFDARDLVIGKKVNGYTFHKVLGVSAKQCWNECGSRTICSSFNYVRRFHLCELNSPTTEDALVDATGYVFKQMKPSETCDVNTCHQGHTCDSEMSTCVLTECLPLPVPKDGFKKGNVNAIGSIAILGCDEGFYNHVNSCSDVISVCTANSTNTVWSVPEFNCTKPQGNSIVLGEKRYFVEYINTETWEGAQKICREKGGHLVEIESMCENNILADVSINVGGERFWTGANDLNADGIWKWSTSSTALSYTNWGLGEPDGENEHCILLLTSTWHDADCDRLLRYICEDVKEWYQFT